MKNDAMSFKVVVKAPFFDDPPGPPKTPTPAGEPLFGLWDYECKNIRSPLLIYINNKFLKTYII